MNEQAKEKMIGMLLEELKTGTPQWYYISIANEKEFYGGFILRGYGPTDAWMKLHWLRFYPLGSDYSTNTNGPILDEVMEKIPKEMRWRKLTKEELTILES